MYIFQLKLQPFVVYIEVSFVLQISTLYFLIPFCHLQQYITDYSQSS